MKILSLSAIALSLILTACASNQVIVNSTSNVSKVNVNLSQVLPMNEQQLAGIWQLTNHTLLGNDNQPLKLQFQQGKVSVLNGCNHINASYQIVNNHLTINSPISTRMACEETLMALDNLAVTLLKGKIVLEKVVDSSTQNISLKITTDGKNYHLRKVG